MRGSMRDVPRQDGGVAAPRAPQADGEGGAEHKAAAGPLGTLYRFSDNGAARWRWRLPAALRGDPSAADALARAWRKAKALNEDHLQECISFDPAAGEIVLRGGDDPPLTLGEWLGRADAGAVAERAFAFVRHLGATIDHLERIGALPPALTPQDILIETRTEHVGGRDVERPEPVLREFVMHGAVRDLLPGGPAGAEEPWRGEWRAPGLAPGAAPTAAALRWTLARIAYRMLAGRVPDRTPTPVPGLSSRRNAALLRALSPNPARRFATCAEFACRLETGRPPRRAGSGRRAAILSVLLLALGLAAGRWYVGSREAEVVEVGGDVEEIPTKALSPEAEARLAEARAAKAAGRWAACREAARDVLREDPGHAEARTLESAATEAMRPWLRIEADRPGAWIVRKGERVRLPTSIRLEPGRTEGPWDVKAVVDGTTWSAFIPEFRVEEGWTGERTRRIVLSRGEVGSGAERKRRTVTLPEGRTFTMIWCPPGTFRMGNHGSESARDVRLTKGFWLAERELTVGEWKTIRPRTPSSVAKWNNSLKRPALDDLDARPIENVRWEEAQAFLRELNERGVDQGLGFRLPTEAEWEYACRAGTTGDYAGSLDDMAWYADTANSIRITDPNTRVVVSTFVPPQPGGRKKPNPWGFLDMHGNVSEWCSDAWDADWWRRQPSGAPLVDPRGPANGEGHVVRGGNVQSSASECASHARKGAPRVMDGFDGLFVPRRPEDDTRLFNVGIRLAADEID